MDKASLQQALDDISKRFNELDTQKEQWQKQIDSANDEIVKINTEQVKLQGEYRFAERQLNELKEKDDAKDKPSAKQ